MLRLQTLQTIIFILNTLRGFPLRIQNSPRATQSESDWLAQGRRILLADSWFSAFFCYSSDIIGGVMRIHNMAGAALFYQIGT